MFRRNVRIAILPVLGILAFTLMVLAVFGRLFRVLIPLLIVIFVFARVASSDKNDRKWQEEQKRQTVDPGKSDRAEKFGSKNYNGKYYGDPTYNSTNYSSTNYRGSNSSSINFSGSGTVRTGGPDLGKVKENERAEYSLLMEQLRKIDSSLYLICCMDIRNTGCRVQRLAQNIVHERYVEHNDCKGFSQFKNYYLPTLRKTVENYSSMERKGIIDMKVREDMLSYLRSCEEAFTRLYNSMFDDDILNMEVQMEAMNVTLKRDGLL